MCTKTNSQQCDSLDLGSSQNRGTLDSWSGAADWRRDAFCRCQPALGSSTPGCNRLLVFRASWRHVGTTNCNQTQQAARKQQGKCYSGYEKSAGGHRFLSNYPPSRVVLSKHCSNPHSFIITPVEISTLERVQMSSSSSVWSLTEDLFMFSVRRRDKLWTFPLIHPCYERDAILQKCPLHWIDPGSEPTNLSLLVSTGRLCQHISVAVLLVLEQIGNILNTDKSVCLHRVYVPVTKSNYWPKHVIAQYDRWRCTHFS